MRFALLVAAAVAVGSAAALAQNVETIKTRKDAFKAMAESNKAVSAIVKGEKPFEMAPVQAALKTFQEQANKLKGLFPDDSKTGGDTGALPEIWLKKAEFVGLFDKLASDAKAAEASIKDEATLKADWPKLLGDNCGGCHKVYKKKDS